MGKVFVDAQGSVRNGWKVSAYLLGTALTMLILGLILHPLRAAWPRLPQVLPEGWIGAAAALTVARLALHLEGETFASLGLKPDRRFLRDLAFGTLGGVALIVTSAAIVYGFGGFHAVRTPGVGLQGLLQGAWLFLAVACFEEILFRGYPFQRAVRGFGFTGAQWVFAACFALVHWGNPGMHGATKVWATLNIGLAAVLLAFCWRRTGSLALPIGVHLGWNWAQGCLLGFGVSGTSIQGWWTPVFHGRPEWLTGGTFGLEASLPCALVCAAAVVGLWRWKGSAPSADASTALAS
jgi:membrane protease YdiL (CAAX protease family)